MRAGDFAVVEQKLKISVNWAVLRFRSEIDSTDSFGAVLTQKKKKKNAVGAGSRFFFAPQRVLSTGTTARGSRFCEALRGGHLPGEHRGCAGHGPSA